MSDPLVLVAPAMAVGSRYYRPLVEAFGERGWQATALPRRGFEPGGPRASRREDWSYGDEVAVVTEAVAAARVEHPDRPVVLLGHSLGGQLSLAHQLGPSPADGLVAVGGCLPHHVLWPWRGPQVALMGGVVVPVLTAVRGYLPPPAFGAPGARTLMREWGRMALTGRTPFPCDGRVTSPSLLVSLEDDGLAPRRAVDAFAARFFDPAGSTRCRPARATTTWPGCARPSRSSTGWWRGGAASAPGDAGRGGSSARGADDPPRSRWWRRIGDSNP